MFGVNIYNKCSKMICTHFHFGFWILEISKDQRWKTSKKDFQLASD